MKESKTLMHAQKSWCESLAPTHSLGVLSVPAQGSTPSGHGGQQGFTRQHYS